VLTRRNLVATLYCKNKQKYSEVVVFQTTDKSIQFPVFLLFCCYRLRLAPRKGGKFIVQPRILMAAAFALSWHLNKTYVPEMPKAGSSDNC